MPLQWRSDKEEKYAASECGRFSIWLGGWIDIHGKRTWMFQAQAKSLVNDSGYYREGTIGQFETMEQAKRACQQHAIHVYRDMV